MRLIFEIDEGVGFRFVGESVSKSSKIDGFLEAIKNPIPSWESDPSSYPQPQRISEDSLLAAGEMLPVGYLNEDAILKLQLPYSDVAQRASELRWSGVRVRALAFH